MKNIFWFDPDINNTENKYYYEQLKTLKYDNIQRYDRVDEEAIKEMSKIKFEEIIIIVSGKLFIYLVEGLNRYINNICFIPRIVIFTANQYEFMNSLHYNEKYIFHPFYNCGGIKNKFDDILEFVQNPLNEEKIPRRDEGGLCFDYIDKDEKLNLPLLYKYLLESHEKNYKSFNNFLREKYKENKSETITKFLYLIDNLSDVPIEVLCKYYLWIYTDEKSKFYKDLNEDLRNNKIDNYLTYIKVLYKGIELKSLPLASKVELYRGTVLKLREIEKYNNALENKKKENLKDLPGPVIFSKSFLSFSKSREEAEKFLKNDKDNSLSLEELTNVLFILEKDYNIDHSLATHADIGNISLFPKEQEVLFFPFSCFEVKEIIPKKNERRYEIIIISYLGKYLKNIKIDALNEIPKEIPDSEFKKEITNSGLIKRENVKNNKEIIKKYEIAKNRIDQIKEIYNPPSIRAYKGKKLYRIFVEEIPPIKPISRQSSIEVSKDFNNNHGRYIFGKLLISENDINKNIRIINSYEETKRNYNYLKVDNESKYINEQQIRENCEIRINGKIFNFMYFVKISKPAMYNIEYIFKNNLTRTDFMFAECYNLKYLDLKDFDTQNVTNMSCMFFHCTSLEELNFYNFNTENLNDMNNMFYGCQSLKKLDLTFFNTLNVVNMSRLFSGCKSLEEIDLSSFNTQNVINMYGMFEECTSLKDIHLSNFYTQNVINITRMFFGCSSLEKLNLSNFITNKVIYMSYMFYGCSKLKELDLSNFTTENVINLDDMFIGCYSLKIENIKCKTKANLIRRCGLYK